MNLQQNEGNSIYQSLVGAEISLKASNGIHWLRWIVTYPVKTVIWFLNNLGLANGNILSNK